MNIYLGTALLLASGLDGVKNKIEPNTPTTEDIDSLTEEERKNLSINKLPPSLQKSLEAFENSKFIKKILGKQLVDLYIEVKREEIEQYQTAKNDGKEGKWELDKYLLL